jgi:hypothetical protein
MGILRSAGIRTNCYIIFLSIRRVRWEKNGKDQTSPRAADNAGRGGVFNLRYKPLSNGRVGILDSPVNE